MRGFIFNIKFKITQPLVPPEKERKYNLVCIIEGKQRSRRLYPSETDKENLKVLVSLVQRKVKLF